MRPTFLFNVLLFFIPVFIFGQSNDTVVPKKTNERVFINQFSSLAYNSSDRSNITATNTDSYIIIQQIGDGNSIESLNDSGQLTGNYIQFGNFNSIKSYNTINKSAETVIQQGNNNRLLNYSFGSINESSLNIIQSGNNLNLEKIGTNAQTNNMALKITGDNRTVIIRSY
ncbi:SH3 domain-containing protein [Winogradskyella aurantiaca]|uniref:hypothetical protein n=1 Tax=Winogradskyella aurantiaca TaxID=2219558 RepID=UPI000E1E28BC|nr:hypothetical protein [Winogradskyella aurantiaca]